MIKKRKDNNRGRACEVREEKRLHFLAGEAVGKRPLGSHRSRLENAIID